VLIENDKISAVGAPSDLKARAPAGTQTLRPADAADLHP